MKRRGAFLILCAALVLSACESDGEDGSKLAFGTYNAGLAYAYVPHAEQRQPLIGPAISGLDVDVLCVQEVWTPEDVQALLTATSTAFPHSYWVDTTDTESGGEPACGAAEADALKTCAAENCGTAASELASCVPTACPDEFGALSDECLRCLVANLGKPLDEMVTACAENAGSEFTYDGVNGLVLLSRWPLEDRDVLDVPSTFTRRAALYAHVTPGDGTPVDVFCTHLTPEFNDVPYPGDFESWDAEQAMQIDRVLAWIDEKQPDGAKPTVVLGDMNTGPAVGGAGEELPDNYARFTAAGFVAPFVDSSAAQCSYCAENPLNVDGTRDVLIDHVLLRDVPGDAIAERVLDGPVSIETDDGTQEVRLSDHYGVVVTIDQ